MEKREAGVETGGLGLEVTHGARVVVAWNKGISRKERRVIAGMVNRGCCLAEGGECAVEVEEEGRRAASFTRCEGEGEGEAAGTPANPSAFTGARLWTAHTLRQAKRPSDGLARRIHQPTPPRR